MINIKDMRISSTSRIKTIGKEETKREVIKFALDIPKEFKTKI